MKLDILVLTQPSRAVFLSQLMSILDPQIKGSDVGVQVRLFDGGIGLGENREKMRRDATGDYIAFLDDDDLIAPNYISSIVPLLNGVDQVSFNVHIFRDGKRLKMAMHSLKYNGWSEDRNAYYRDISHATPMRRELALSVPMSGGIGEDHRWATAMRGKVMTENHIDDALYYYLIRSRKNDARDATDHFRLSLLEQIRSSMMERV